MEDWNGTTQYERDALERLKVITDHNGRKLSYEWDAVGNLTALTYPDGEKAQFTYDAEKRQLSAVK